MALELNRLAVGDRYSEVLVEDLKRTQIVQYAGASGDFNPIHTDEVFATKAAGYPSVFAHGMLTMGMTGRAVTNYVGDDRLRQFGVRFTSPVWPGDTLTATVVVEEIVEEAGEPFVKLKLSTTNQHGVEVMSGYAVAKPD